MPLRLIDASHRRIPTQAHPFAGHRLSLCGQHVLYGSALVLAAAVQAWARHPHTPVIDPARAVIR